MSAGIPAAVRTIVLSRAGGKCERCGRLADVELHHRKFRSRGGRHIMSNLVALCGWGNHTGCHGWAHTSPEAREQGYAIPSWVEETWEVPLLVPSPSGVKRWVLFTETVKREWEPVRSEDARRRLFDLGVTNRLEGGAADGAQGDIVGVGSAA
jgi:hypothetical protein